jgi:hypothetical protein
VKQGAFDDDGRAFILQKEPRYLWCNDENGRPSVPPVRLQGCSEFKEQFVSSTCALASTVNTPARSPRRGASLFDDDESAYFVSGRRRRSLFPISRVENVSSEPPSDDRSGSGEETAGKNELVRP